MAEELLPCPFCGNKDTLIDEWTHIRCDWCGARGPVCISDNESPGGEWNERVEMEDE